GLCARACPWGILALADRAEHAAVGTPYFVARQGPCEMCPDIPCVVACPTGALDSALTDIARARMGVAVLVGRETCLNLQGLRCDVCYRVCPLIGQAIALEAQHDSRTGKHAKLIPTVRADACTGCGKCEQACVLEQAAIKVLPLHLAAVKPDRHYRYGWKAEAKS
ncbi:MAG: ferredoxin-type protein NapG, partial [Alphaproteobacteria bacterium]|nr:ferredoxin-type protein NapG [Alphaproteobacteria bacterium]